MSSISGRNARGAALLAVLLVSAPVAAEAQGWRELQLGALAVASRPVFGGLSGGLAWRDRGRTRLAISLSGGVLESGKVGARIEALWNFLLDPQRSAGSAIYGGGGFALAGSPGASTQAFIVLALGVESSPGSRRSTFVEAGVGGGARLAAGIRWRAPRRSR